MRRCQGLIDEARLAHEQLLALAGGPSGNLRVSMPYSLAIWLLPEIINDFTERYPDIECEFDLSMLTARIRRARRSTSCCASAATPTTTCRPRASRAMAAIAAPWCRSWCGWTTTCMRPTATWSATASR